MEFAARARSARSVHGHQATSQESWPSNQADILPVEDQELGQSGLITSRTQGRAVYYRLTQPEPGILLQAAGQLLATAPQQATEEKANR